MLSVLHSAADGFLISDMTLDANFAGQPPSYADTRSPAVFKPAFPYAAAGFGCVSAFGDNLTVRSVRFINHGSRYQAFDGSEGMAMSPFAPDMVKNFLVEDCIFERPYPNRARETEGIAVEGTGTYVRCAFRNNYFDGASVNLGPFPPVAVQSLIFSGGQATLVTTEQHGLQKDEEVKISGTSGGTYDDI